MSQNLLRICLLLTVLLIAGAPAFACDPSMSPDCCQDDSCPLPETSYEAMACCDVAQVTRAATMVRAQEMRLEKLAPVDSGASLQFIPSDLRLRSIFSELPRAQLTHTFTACGSRCYLITGRLRR